MQTAEVTYRLATAGADRQSLIARAQSAAIYATSANQVEVTLLLEDAGSVTERVRRTCNGSSTRLRGVAQLASSWVRSTRNPITNAEED